MIRPDRLTASFEGTFVVFLLGMHVNTHWKVHRWLPVVRAMPRMLIELANNPDMGMLGGDTWFGRTTIQVQYWRSLDHLLAYAANREAAHLPAWKAFNQGTADSGDVGIWHETYVVEPGTYENIYVNMPTFGLGRVGTLMPATGQRHTARARFQAGAGPAPAAGVAKE